VRVKICGIVAREDAEMCVAAGADALGFLCGVPKTVRCYVEPAHARSIVAAVPPYVSTVMVTTLSDPAAIEELIGIVPVAALQLHGAVVPEALSRLRRSCGWIKLIKTIQVTGPESIEEADRWQGHADALLLDTKGQGDIGGTGRVHDWGLSRQIREAVTVPVILAGGLFPENVAAAVSAVHPFAVDVNSGVTDATRKDPSKVARFIASAR
jgi:phosphoribosylanthranilate isomerase